jgi:hypothetical protein
MYNGTSIQLLTDRIGWADAVPPTSIVVDAGNMTSTSERYFNSFHQLVTVENVLDCVSNLKIEGADLNAYLAKMRKDSVLEVLNKLFNTNELANYERTEDKISLNYNASGYDALIAERQTVFDEAIGYAMAVRALQLLITSERSNSTQRSIKSSYEFLKSELEGIKDAHGNIIAKGVNTLFTTALENAKKVLFPTKTESAKRTLQGKQVW